VHPVRAAREERGLQQAVPQHAVMLPPGNDPVRVLTVDDDARYRGLVREVIAATAGFDIVGEACSGEDGVAMAAALHPELVLMDVRMPGIGGLEAARRIAARGDDHVAVVLMSADPQTLRAETVCGRTIGLLRKERLGPRALRAVWEAWGAARRA
jgi:two-component system, NarL family, invasion response regulator UvrY